jgi:hypothetical protein
MQPPASRKARRLWWSITLCLTRPQASKDAIRHREILIDCDFTIGKTEPRLFGSFTEHLGRGVYGGIYEPEYPTADASGYRQDVLALIRELGPTIVRYPSGKFVSAITGKMAWGHGQVGPAVATIPGLRPSQQLRHQRVHRLAPPGRHRADARGRRRQIARLTN